MKHAFLVVADADLTAEDVKNLICNDASISRLSIGSDKVKVAEIELAPHGPQPDVVVENLSRQNRYSFPEEQLISL